jgi:hypothetical protein
MFENVWLSGQMHTKFAQMTPTFLLQTYQYEYKKHDLYPDLKFVDACVIKSVKKVLGKNAGKHSKTKIFKTGKLF